MHLGNSLSRTWISRGLARNQNRDLQTCPSFELAALRPLERYHFWLSPSSPALWMQNSRACARQARSLEWFVWVLHRLSILPTFLGQTCRRAQSSSRRCGSDGRGVCKSWIGDSLRMEWMDYQGTLADPKHYHFAATQSASMNAWHPTKHALRNGPRSLYM